MPTPSFHRRIFPWIFIIGFFIIAPIVVFYTSGYRWNSKKGKVERSSTVIVDSTPTGAALDIDGRPSGEETPVTIQNISPGTHRFLVSKSGYFPWEKSLDVRPELVTFANNIQLWRQTQPTLQTTDNATSITTSPDGRSTLKIVSTTSTTVILTTETDQKSTSVTLPNAILGPVQAFWSDSGRFALLEPKSSAATPYLVDTRNLSTPLELPAGMYRWENAKLVGNDGKNLLSIQVPQFTIKKTALSPDLLDQSETAELRTTTSTDHVIYVSADQPERGLVLPSGNWKLWSHTKSYTLLRDGSHWLALRDAADTPEYHQANGDMLRTLPSTGTFNITALTSKTPDQFLLVNGEELWIWNPLMDPQLMLRVSGRIVNAAWHAKGNDVFFATEKAVFVINLDPRDGYLTTQLASFDTIADMTMTGTHLTITGTRDGKSGIWNLEVE